MAIKYNSSSDIVREIKYNNNDVKILFYDGKLVWAKPYKLVLSEQDKSLFVSIEPNGSTDRYERNSSGIILREGDYIFHGETLLINNLYSHTVTNGYLTYDLHATFTVYSSQNTPGIEFEGIVGDVCIYWGDGESTTDRLKGVHKYVSKTLNYTENNQYTIKVIITNSIYNPQSSYIKYIPEDSVWSFNFKDFTVVRLPVDFMYSNYFITNVTLNNGLQVIEDSAFYDCSYLQEVTLPESLTEIWTDAFRDCYSLSSINLPNNLIKLGSGAFANCELLSTISIPGTIELDPEVDTDIFENCYDLEYVQFGEGLQNLSHGMFYNCTSLKEVVFPSTLKVINESAFADSGLAKITIPGNVSVVEARAFKDCTELSEVTIEDGVTIIEDEAFAYTSIENLTLPESIVEIKGAAFGDISTLKSANIPNSLIAMSGIVFQGCTNLQTLTVKTGYWEYTQGTNSPRYMKSTNLRSNLITGVPSALFRPYAVAPITFSKNYISTSDSVYTFNGSITNPNPFSIDTFTCVKTSSKVGYQQKDTVSSELAISVGSLTGNTILAYTLPVIGYTPIGDATRIVYTLSGSNWSATTTTVSAADAIAESFAPSIYTSIQGSVSATTRDFQYYIKNNNKEAITASVTVRKGTFIIDSYSITIAAETSSSTKNHATTATATFTVDVTFQKYGQLVYQTASKTIVVTGSGDGPTILPIE